MGRITIECSETDQKELREILSSRCPFISNYPSKCGEDARCDECIEDNVDFIIVEESDIDMDEVLIKTLEKVMIAFNPKSMVLSEEQKEALLMVAGTYKDFTGNESFKKW